MRAAHILGCGLLALALGVFAPSGALAATSAIGADGEVLRLVAGAYGELFPDGDEANADDQVLALEVLGADGTVRHLVPETASASPEDQTTLIFEHTTGTAYLLWQGTLDLVHTVLHLTSWDGAAWGPVLEITGNPYTSKANPHLVVVRDDHPDPDDPSIDVRRTTIHVSWAEETAGGMAKRWTPILIEGGEHLSWMPTWNLSDLLPSIDDDPVVQPVNAALHVDAGWKESIINVGFLTTLGDRLGVVEIEILPGELDSLADWARWQADIDGQQYDDPVDFALAFHDLILQRDAGFHPATQAYMAEQVREVIATSTEALDAEGLAVIAERVRQAVIETGVRFGGVGLIDLDPFQILEVERPDNPESRHLLKATVRLSRTAPADLGDDPRLFLSERGTEVIVAWLGEDAVTYVESSDVDDWTDPRSIPITDAISADAIFALLDERLRDR